MFKKTTGKCISIPAGIGLGVLLSLGISLAGSAITAYLLISERMTVEGIGWGALVILAVSSFAGAILAFRLVKTNRLPVCLSVGVGYILVLLGGTALFFGGQYQGIVAAVVTVLLASTVAGIICFKSKKATVRKKKIPAYR